MMEPMTRPHADTPRFVYIAVGITSLGGLVFGYDFAVISGAILFIKKQFSLSPTIEEIVVTTVVLGALVGAAAGGPLTDRFGRRTVLILSAVIFALGALATALAPTVTWLILGRLIIGVAVGTVTIATPLYISEVSPQNARGLKHGMRTAPSHVQAAPTPQEPSMHQDHPMTHGHSAHGSCGMIPSPCVGGDFSGSSGEPDSFSRRSLEQTKEATL